MRLVVNTGVILRCRVAVPLVTAFMVCVVGCSGDSSESDPQPSADSPSSSEPAFASARVEVKVGFCFVQPVSFDGQMWNVPLQHQFDLNASGKPVGWQGKGVMYRVSDHRARYDDDGGSSVVFLPVDHPDVAKIDLVGCD